jgi:hypothetical protein
VRDPPADEDEDQGHGLSSSPRGSSNYIRSCRQPSQREIINDPSHEDRAKMTLAVLERTGFHAVTEHKVSVDSTADRLAMLREIVRLAGATGQDWRNLLGAASDITDADFHIVEAEILQIEGRKQEETDWENLR